MIQDLKSHLWECAEILRRSAVDSTDWKAYILPPLFFKRISDVLPRLFFFRVFGAYAV
jgi:type I restriction-modification system DNA methylase subunit